MTIHQNMCKNSNFPEQLTDCSGQKVYKKSILNTVVYTMAHLQYNTKQYLNVHYNILMIQCTCTSIHKKFNFQHKYSVYIIYCMYYITYLKNKK